MCVHDIELEYSTLEMGFDTYPVDDVPDIGNNIQPAENPLELGFEMDPVHNILDQSRKFSLISDITLFMI